MSNPIGIRHWELHELGEIHHQGEAYQPKGAWVVYGGQAGSEGKGAIAGYLATAYNWGAAICTFMPNAGHTFIENGRETVVSQLPQALVSSSVERLLIAPGSVIDLDKLHTEIEKYDDRYDVKSRLRIHPRAMILESQDPEWEEEHLRYIASTAKGCGAALARKIRREESVKLAGGVNSLAPYLADTTRIVNQTISGGRGVLVEQAQGFDLDINHGVSYPYCTSRGTTPMQILADCGIAAQLMARSIAVIRTHPIRVGNVEGGHSGEYGSDEIDWDTVSSRAGRSVEEKTTVTKRVRRVFEPDFDRLGEMSDICRPTDIALTFADYVDKDVFGVTHEEYMNSTMGNLSVLSARVSEFVDKVERAMRRSTMNPRVKLVKTGPNNDHILRLLDL